MYFVVHLRIFNKFVVVPMTWIKGISGHIEKFMNQSINRNQIFLIYYTSNEAAFLGDFPKKDFEPDFGNLVTRINNDGSFDGSFFGKLHTFTCKSSNVMFQLKVTEKLKR